MIENRRPSCVQACRRYGQETWYLDHTGFMLAELLHPFQILERMELVIKSRLAVTEEKLGEYSLPRIVRIARKLNFTENEARMTTYTLIAQCGYEDKNGFSAATDCVSISQFLDIPIVEVLEFVSESRTHMEQGFFPDIQQSYIMSSNMTYEGGFCKALMGGHLKSEEFVKLEQTVLADVIAEEPGNEHYR